MASRMSIQDKLNYAEERFGSLGLNQDHVAGIAGSLMGESGRSLNANAYNPNDPNGGSFGIGQHQGTRRTALEEFAAAAGTAANDYKTQVDFIVHELQTTEKKAFNKVKAASTPQAAARAWTTYYERPAAATAHHATRAKNALYAKSILTGTPATEEAYVDPSLVNMSLTGATQGMEVEAPQQQGFLGGIENAISGIGGAVSGAVTGLGSSYKDVKNDVVGSLPEGIQGFFGDANLAAKVGAIAGGLLSGGAGAVVGGVLGQGIGMMLNGINQQPQQSQPMGFQNTAGFSRDYFPEAPAGNGNKGRDPRESKEYADSKQVRDAVDSGTGGLW